MSGGGGATGPTGATGNAGCCQIGYKTIVVPVSPILFIVTPAMLQNPSHPGATYLGLIFTGGGESNLIVLPKPATDDEAYEITLEGRMLSSNSFANDHTGNTPVGNSIILQNRQITEVSLEDEIDARAAGGLDEWTYRTKVVSRSDGLWRVPGFTGPVT